MRKRGVERYNILLDATERLLGDNSDEDISLAQIAEAAEVPLASVYHFFPNRNAAFVALALRFNEQIYQTSITPLADPEPQTWQELLHMIHARAADFQNKRPAALRLFLGAGVSVAVRNADLSGNARIARSRERFFDAYFHMPIVPDFVERLEIAGASMDGIWGPVLRASRPDHRTLPQGGDRRGDRLSAPLPARVPAAQAGDAEGARPHLHPAGAHGGKSVLPGSNACDLSQ